MTTVHQPDPKSAHLVLDTTPLPTATHPDDHLVRVVATAPCLGELWWVRNFPDLFKEYKEPVPCSDLAGIIVSAPVGSPFKPGDEVWARIDAMRPGAAREYTLARLSELALKPKTFNWAQTAATPLSALTAWQGLFRHGGLDSAAIFGDETAKAKNSKLRVLLTGAGGGVGGWAVQFAAAAGAEAIVAVCSASKAATVRRIGATEVVDYTTQGVDVWAAEDPKVRECDLVFDCIGGSGLASLWGAAKDGGVFLSIVGSPDSVKPEGVTKTLAKSMWFLVEPLGSELNEIAKLIDAGGKFEPLIDSIWELKDIEKAFELVEGRKTNGKVVVKVGPEA